MPTLSVAKTIARALGISIDELAGEDTHRVDLSGDWCACWQTVKDGAEVLNPHQITMRQRGDNVWRSSPSRAYPLDEGGYELPLVPWRTPLCCFEGEPQGSEVVGGAPQRPKLGPVPLVGFPH